MMRRVISVCCTQYQLINILNLSETKYKDYIVDIVIVNKFRFAKNYYESLLKTRTNENIYFVDIEALNILEKEKLLINKLKLKDYIPTFKACIYDELLIANNLYMSNIILANLRKFNKKIFVTLIEDGVATYIRKFEDLGRKIYFVNKFLGRKFITNKDIKKVFVYDKDLISFSSDYTYLNMEKIDQIIFDKILRRLSISKTVLDIPNIIYFDQPFTKDNISINELDVIDFIINKYGDVAIKMHPRQDGEIYKNINKATILEEIPIPWELAVRLVKNLNEHTFITVNSTAVFTPIILYGAKCKVVLLEKNFPMDNKIDKFIDKFNKKYK